VVQGGKFIGNVVGRSSVGKLQNRQLEVTLHGRRTVEGVQECGQGKRCQAKGPSGQGAGRMPAAA